MSIDYQIRRAVVGDDQDYATFSKRNFYIEVPIEEDENEEAIQAKLDNAFLSATLKGIVKSEIHDVVHCRGEVVRNDYTVRTAKGLAIVAKLQEQFPDYADWFRSKYNVIGEYSGYREPYANPSISWYDFEVKPSASLMEMFNVSQPESNLKEWYGLKFDLVTKEVLFKVVVEELGFESPELPRGIKFYALTHDMGGAASEWVDSYIYATENTMREWCLSKGLQYPLPSEKEVEEGFIWIWGVVFNSKTQEYGPVKSYTRHNV